MPAVPLESRLLQALAPWREAGGWCVAFSGGLDSTVLLHLLAQLARSEALPALSALHVHHGLQAAADGWPAHCQAVCRSLGIPLRVERVQVAGGGSARRCLPDADPRPPAVPPGAPGSIRARPARRCRRCRSAPAARGNRPSIHGSPHPAPVRHRVPGDRHRCCGIRPAHRAARRHAGAPRCSGRAALRRPGCRSSPSVAGYRSVLREKPPSAAGSRVAPRRRVGRPGRHRWHRASRMATRWHLCRRCARPSRGHCAFPRLRCGSATTGTACRSREPAAGLPGPPRAPRRVRRNPAPPNGSARSVRRRAGAPGQGGARTASRPRRRAPGWRR